MAYDLISKKETSRNWSRCTSPQKPKGTPMVQMFRRVDAAIAKTGIVSRDLSMKAQKMSPVAGEGCKLAVDWMNFKRGLKKGDPLLRKKTTLEAVKKFHAKNKIVYAKLVAEAKQKNVKVEGESIVVIAPQAKKSGIPSFLLGAVAGGLLGFHFA